LNKLFNPCPGLSVIPPSNSKGDRRAFVVGHLRYLSENHHNPFNRLIKFYYRLSLTPPATVGGEVSFLAERGYHGWFVAKKEQAVPESNKAQVQTGTAGRETCAPIESILCNEELNCRPSRPPDYEIENKALAILAQALADSPETILQALTDNILDVLQANSAGISLLTKDEKRFYWPAISGIWKPHIGGGTPRDFGPCGDVLDRNRPLMMKRVERRYDYFRPVIPAVEECLLVPFYVRGKAVGTIWAVAHDNRRRFDAEDLRRLESLARFASSAYQITESISLLKTNADALARDITESKRVRAELAEAKEIAEAANKSKDRFLAALSHELRTPLSPVLMTAAAMELNPKLPPAFRNDVAVIRRNVELEAKLIDDLLDLSRVIAGKLTLNILTVDVNEAVGHVCTTCRPFILEKAIHLQCNAPEAALYVKADPTRLQQVLWNLLRNAAKFTPERGKIDVTISKIGEDRVRIQVLDTGIGIAPDVLPRIFNAFEQGDASITRQFGGLGLGLAISKALTEMHQGTIRAESGGRNSGAIFTVEFPLASAPAPTHPAPKKDGQRPGRPLRVLVVDDHPDTVMVLSMLLGAYGHKVLTATSAAAALDLAGKEQFDVIVSDIGLPDATGYELMQQIKSRHSMKGIAMSGYGLDEDVRKSRDAGFSDHVVKPANVAQLEQTIRRVAGQSK
jgi:signal transduction histidine kinase/CheY-like chemotaxis protein